MQESPFRRFINLVAVDQRIQFLVQKKNMIEQAVKNIEQQKHDQEFYREQINQKIITLKKNISAQELDLKTLDSREKDKKSMLERLSDYRECQAAKSDLEGIHRLQIAQERVILDLWSQLEAAQVDLEKKQAEHLVQREKFEQELSVIEQNKQAVVHDLSQLASQRAEMCTGIPQEWLEKYGVMGQQVNNPVVPIEFQSCSGCYQQLVSQDLIRARRGALLQCKKCFRLLYLAESNEVVTT